MRLPEEDLQKLGTALEIPINEVPMRLKFTVKTTEIDRTYEQQRMNMLSLSQIYAQYAQQTAPLAQTLFGPQGTQMQQMAPDAWKYMSRILVGSGKLMTRIFEFFGIHETGEYIPDPEALDDVVDAMQGAFQAPGAAPMAPPMGGGPAGPAGADPMGPGGPMPGSPMGM